jgi:hypothetical protein
MEPRERGLAPLSEGPTSDCIALRRLVVPDDRRLSASKMRLLFFPICLRVCLVKVPEERKILGVGDWRGMSKVPVDLEVSSFGKDTTLLRPTTLSNPSTIGFGSRSVQCGHAQ